MKELGVLNPPTTPGCLPLFLLLVSSSWGKVVSAAPPPNLDTQEIGHSLVIDQDEESVLSNSYSDHHFSTVASSAMWGKHTACSTDKEQNPWATERRDKDGHKSGNKDCDKNCDRECEKSKKSDSQHGSDRPHGCSP